METYRLSSKLRENENEYLIQTANDANVGAVATSVFVNGVLAERVACPHPDDVDPQALLQLVKSTHGEKKKEIESLLEAFRTVVQSGQPETMYHLGTAFYYKGFYAEARELFGKATQLDNEHHQAFNHLGLTEMALAQTGAAIEAAARAVAMRPRYADYRNNYGEALLADQRYDAAIVEFETAIKINMYYSDAYLNLGLARMLEAHLDPDTALWPERRGYIRDLMNKAALIYEKYKGARFEAGLESLQKADLHQSLAIFRSIRETKREAARQQFGALQSRFMVMGEWVTESAIADRVGFLKAELKKNPTYVDLHAELSQCYLEQAKLSWQKAIEQYKKSLQVNPSLEKVKLALQEAEPVYEQICAALSRITEKG